MMQLHGLQTKYLSNVQNPWLMRWKYHANLVSEDSNMLEVTEQIPAFLHLEENMHKNDTAVDQSTNMAKEMCRHVPMMLQPSLLQLQYRAEYQLTILADTTCSRGINMQ